jgi:O-methyltransferase
MDKDQPKLMSTPEPHRSPIALADQCIAALPDAEARAAFFDRLITGLLPLDHRRIFWGNRLLALGKSAGFLDDPKFAAAHRQIRGSVRYDQYESPQGVAWRLHTLVWAARNGLSLDGDFVECGVFKGDYAWVVTQVIDFARQQKTFFLYDTFAGFAPAYSSPADFPDNPGFFDFVNKTYSDPGVFPEVIRKFGASPNVRIVRGVLPDTLADGAPEKIAFMHIDLNSPAAEIGVLEALFDRVVPGGVIIFDDYGLHLFRRQKEAEDAFVAARGYAILELPTGQGLLVKR